MPYRQNPRASLIMRRFKPPRAIFEAVYSVEPKHSLKTGDRVFHQKFGYGIIHSVEGNQLEITFETSGLKTIMADFVEKKLNFLDF